MIAIYITHGFDRYYMSYIVLKYNFLAVICKIKGECERITQKHGQNLQSKVKETGPYDTSQFNGRKKG